MRVLHVEKFAEGPFWQAGGVGSYIRCLIDFHRRAGHVVELFGCGDPAREDRVAFEDFDSAGPLALGRMVHNPAAAAKLAAYLRRHPVDVAHLHNVYHHLTPSILPVLRRAGAAVVMTAHDYRLACPAKHFLRDRDVCMRCAGGRFHHAASRRCLGVRGLAVAAESFAQRTARRYFRGVDLLLCPTPFMAAVQRQAGWPGQKLRVAPNPVDPLPLPDAASPKTIDLLYLGRLAPEKGPELLLDLADRLPRARLVVAGAGPSAEAIEAEARRRGLDGIEFRGQVDRRQAGELMAATRAFVLTSRCMENSPAGLLEALGAGVPAVVPDHPPLREWVLPGRTGWRYRPGDPADLAAAAGRLLSQPDRAREMGAEAARAVRARHEPTVAAGRIETFYQEAIHRCASR